MAKYFLLALLSFSFYVVNAQKDSTIEDVPGLRFPLDSAAYD